MSEGGPAQEPRLLDKVSRAIRVRHYSYRTEQQYVAWIRRYVRFHACRHPRSLGGPEVSAFLSYLASAPDRALEAPEATAGGTDTHRSSRRARQPERSPLAGRESPVWQRSAVARGIASSDQGRRSWPAEADRPRRQGQKDRVTVLPGSLVEPLRRHIAGLRASHQNAVAGGFGGVELPHALERKYPHAHLDFGWQYLFPADHPTRDPRSGAWRRHHLYEDTVQRKVREAIDSASVGRDRPVLRFTACSNSSPP